MNYVKVLRIPHFRGIFMRDCLPNKPKRCECAIINLDSINNRGTHWTSYIKEDSIAYYFDSFGNLQPPMELKNYLGSECVVYYNHKKYQNYGTTNCGQLCLQFLHDFYVNKRKI